ncbi:class I SAM-dependent methyltransferase [Bacillus suaedaesalsae]|uniref:Class I SAM-dependent methyltransferase n=1 Tax=Bacillus suaedaesalsae TaxID=2810349 RepID=A0ABS2DGN3_9BACI|nr:class I SAM-dependent methyltransferase [Bacillus suaedaesalsae]MBM6616708.1 class I SAM-dependent methyltransferase [Bacillus suaedaesalsae]
MQETVKQVKEQYKDSKNLDARIGIHELYSTNKQDWHKWLMEQYQLPENVAILELGCGSGAFWVKNKQEIKASWNITLSDFSEGMLENAKRNIGRHPTIQYKQINIMDIPFMENSFDVVIANHMLYHVPDVQKALREVRRVLKPNGTFYTSTIGEKHMGELNTLLTEFNPRYNFLSAYKHATHFGLENGKEQLTNFFQSVHVKDFEGGLEITESEPLIQYILSASKDYSLSEEDINSIATYFNTILIQQNGKLYITKATGLFVAK